uniref:TPR_MLP1_2 domain-containing protein n=1 Tax=Caenorhabditis tropicalis TaxID=1561998 RepID=A0A1I7TF51_9PELO
MSSNNDSLEVLQLRAESASLVSEMEYWKELYTSAMGDAQRAIRDSEDLTQQLYAARDQISVLRIEKEQTDKQMETLREERAVQEELTTQTSTYAALLETMLDDTVEAKAQKAKEAELCGTVDQLQKEKQDLEAMMDEFKAMWTKDTKEFRETTDKLAEYKNQMTAELEEAKSNLDRVQAALHDSEAANADLKANVSKLKTDLVKSQNGLQLMTAKRDSMRECYRKSSAELHESIQKRNSVEASLSEYLEEIDRLKSQLNDLGDEKENLAERLEIARTSYIAANSKLLEANSMYGQVQCDLADAKKSNKDLREEIEKLSEHKELAVEQIKYLEGELVMQVGELNAALEECQKKLDEGEESWKCKEGIFQIEIFRQTREKERIQRDLTEKINILTNDNKQIDCQRLLTEQKLNKTQMDSEVQILRYQDEIKSLKTMLSGSEEARDRDSAMFGLTIESIETELKDSRAQLKKLAKDNYLAKTALEKANVEAERLREQLSQTARDFVAEKEKLEQKQEQFSVALQQKCAKQIDEMKHNNMLAINQEMIKAQMAVDTLKKKNSVESQTSLRLYKESLAQRDEEIYEAQITNARLIQDKAISDAENGRLQEKIRTVKAAGQQDREELLAAFRREREEIEKAHVAEIRELCEEHRREVENMGVSVLDDDSRSDSYEEGEEEEAEEEPKEWEVVEDEE